MARLHDDPLLGGEGSSGRLRGGFGLPMDGSGTAAAAVSAEDSWDSGGRIRRRDGDCGGRQIRRVRCDAVRRAVVTEVLRKLLRPGFARKPPRRWGKPTSAELELGTQVTSSVSRVGTVNMEYNPQSSAEHELLTQNAKHGS